MFSTGSQVSLQDVLQARDERVSRQKDLLAVYPKSTLINFKCNIPGPIKSNHYIKALFEHGLVQIQEELERKSIAIRHQELVDPMTGPEAYLLVEKPLRQIKEMMIVIEEGSDLARLYDIDVLSLGESQDEVLSLSRQDLGLLPRLCFVCDDTAKNCGRSRRHSLEEMYATIEELVQSLTEKM
ncbi:holo-ACP synthase [Streptococcus rupicaprae]|uniref:citrate lyase holo-[acyl-carrier protein] synthase n=1 Tax=Streptococcus rupicaprae TaxID=759619 RepID=A0ABV2FGC1_9STRE